MMDKSFDPTGPNNDKEEMPEDLQEFWEQVNFGPEIYHRAPESGTPSEMTHGKHICHHQYTHNGTFVYSHGHQYWTGAFWHECQKQGGGLHTSDWARTYIILLDLPSLPWQHNMIGFKKKIAVAS